MTTHEASLRRACPKHGLLDNDPRRCPSCDKQTYDLHDEDERATLLAVRRVTERPRRVRWAVAMGVLVVVAKGVVSGVTTGNYSFTVDAIAAAGVVFGFACGWALRSPALHRLDRRLGLKLL